MSNNLSPQLIRCLQKIRDGHACTASVPEEHAKAIEYLLLGYFITTGQTCARHTKERGPDSLYYNLAPRGRAALLEYELQAETVDEPKPSPQQTLVSLDEQALAIFLKEKCSKAEIARRLGKKKQSLSPKRCPQLDAAVKAWKASRDPGQLRGSKDKDGHIEAWDDDE